VGPGSAHGVAAPHHHRAARLVFESLIPSRSVEEIVNGHRAGRLGSATYALPELSMAGTDAWAASIDARLAGLLGAVDRLDSTARSPSVPRGEAVRRRDARHAHRVRHVRALPSRDELRANATHTQVLFAVMGVWATTSSPLAAAVLGIVRALPEIPTGTQSAPTSGLLETLGLTYADSETSHLRRALAAESRRRGPTRGRVRTGGRSGPHRHGHRVHDADASRKWRSHTTRSASGGVGLTGADLEAGDHGNGCTRPGLVVVEG
jgi:hypothetical protein